MSAVSINISFHQTITSKEVELEPESGGNGQAARQARWRASKGREPRLEAPTATNQPIGKGDHTKTTEQSQPQQHQDKGKEPKTAYRGGQARGHTSKINAAPFTGSSTSFASMDIEGNKFKRPNPIFRGIRKEVNKTTINTSRDQYQALNWEGWKQREHHRGYESSPIISEFSDLNGLL